MKPFAEFIDYVTANQGRKFPTVGGRSVFSHHMSEDAIVYSVSTKKLRPQQLQWVERVFNHHRKVKSLKTSDYTHLTVNASYLLALIKSFYKDDPAGPLEDYSERKALEGIAKERKYMSYRRNRDLVEKVKRSRKHTCEACGLGPIKGRSIVDAHHKLPLSRSGRTVTGKDDILVLCPTCHRIAHLEMEPLSLERIRQLRGIAS